MLTRPEHEVAYQDLCKLVSKHADKLSAIELLAVASNMIGKLIAMQDQRTVTRDKALDVLIKNLELGNVQVLDQLKGSKGTA